MTTAEELPKIPPPTEYGTCDQFESQIIAHLVQHTKFVEEGGDPKISRGLMVAYGLAIARKIFAEERRFDRQIFDDIADTKPGSYVADLSMRIRALSPRMRGQLLVKGSGNVREHRHAQQVILEGGNP